MGAYAGAGRFEEAIAEALTAVRLSNRNPSTLGGLAEVYARAGRTAEARRILAELVTMANTRYVSPGVIAKVYFTLGESDRGFEWVEAAYRERSNYMVYIAIDESFDSVRSDPRYLTFLRRVGIE
jgi:tetratricopeptide (TPR) repeat protein